MTIRHLGKLRLSCEILLKFLDFVDASIKDINYNAELDTIDILLEHPEMPEVEAGDRVPLVDLQYIQYEDALGHKVTLRERGVI